eukprot:637038-Pyramimonas_sp.AAC.1
MDRIGGNRQPSRKKSNRRKSAGSLASNEKSEVGTQTGIPNRIGGIEMSPASPSPPSVWRGRSIG